MALPKITTDRIKADAWAKAEYKHGEDNTPYRSGYFYGYIAGATAENERTEQQITKLEQWKSEADLLLAPLLEWGHAQKDIPLGKSITEDILRRAKEYAGVKERAQKLVDTLEWIKTYGPVDDLTVKFIDKALNEWKGPMEQYRARNIFIELFNYFKTNDTE